MVRGANLRCVLHRFRAWLTLQGLHSFFGADRKSSSFGDRKSSILGPKYVVALWDAFYIENARFDLDTLRVPNRSPTPTSKSHDSRGQSDEIWGAWGPHLRPIFGLPGARAGLKHTSFLAL